MTFWIIAIQLIAAALIMGALPLWDILRDSKKNNIPKEAKPTSSPKPERSNLISFRMVKSLLSTAMLQLREQNALVTAVATVVMAAFTISLAIDSSRQAASISGQLNVMKSQLEEMKAQRLVTIAQLRANLRREQLAIRPITPRDIVGDLAADDNTIYWEISSHWTNVGSTDAKRVIGWWEMKSFDNGINGHFGIMKSCPEIKTIKPTPPYNGVTIEKDKDVYQFPKTLSLADATRALQGQTYILAWGQTYYNDVFTKAVHYHNWCVRLLPNDLKKSIFSQPKMSEDSWDEDAG
ncbi:hypothetical protein [Bradyrhizobium oligotrophicum]|uniref:hypothetical protein n=1 Tax=Bradyrhizobium oligotrophicum TaxID=44255 RepID=UPI003EB95DCB